MNLSDPAQALLLRRFAGERVEVTEESRPHYRELAAAGLMTPLHSFSRGDEGAFRLTDMACDLRDRLNGHANPSPFVEPVPSPRD